MSKGQWAFRPAVMTRAIKAAEKAGKLVVGTKIDSVDCIVDNALVMTDADGKPVDREKHHLTSGQDARLLACRLVRPASHGPTRLR